MKTSISNLSLSAAAAILLLGTAPLALAQTNTPSATKENPVQMPNEPTASGKAGSAEIQAFEGAKTSLSSAIGTAQSHTGGKAVEAFFENHNGKPAYRVTTLQNNAVWQGIIDANSGKLSGQGTTMQVSQLSKDEQTELAAVQSVRNSLQDAINAAENAVQNNGKVQNNNGMRNNGKAIAAGLEAQNGKTWYEVQVVRNGKVEAMNVNPTTGKVASNAPMGTTEGSGSSTAGKR